MRNVDPVTGEIQNHDTSFGDHRCVLLAIAIATTTSHAVSIMHAVSFDSNRFQLKLLRWVNTPLPSRSTDYSSTL